VRLAEDTRFLGAGARWRDGEIEEGRKAVPLAGEAEGGYLEVVAIMAEPE